MAAAKTQNSKIGWMALVLRDEGVGFNGSTGEGLEAFYIPKIKLFLQNW